MATISEPQPLPLNPAFLPESKESSTTDWRQSSAGPKETNSIFQAHHPRLLTFEEIPEWYQDNNCILASYRPISHSAAACLASWLYIHNESVSIYSHLIPALLFLLAEAVIHPLFVVRYPNATIGDRLVFVVFLTTATVCLGLSAAYHTLINHSKQVSELSLRSDFVGIVILTQGFFISGIYVGFYCEPKLRWIYWGMILGLGTITSIILILPAFQGPRYRTLRVCAFVGTGMTGFAPIVHGFVRFGWRAMIKQSGVPYYFGEGFLLVLGALLYTVSWSAFIYMSSKFQAILFAFGAGLEVLCVVLLTTNQTRIPEIYRPGRFDIYGASHQIFHLLVVLAAILHLIAISLAFDYNYHYRKC